MLKVTDKKIRRKQHGYLMLNEYERTIKDKQGKIIASVTFLEWYDKRSRQKLTKQLHQAGYDWHQVEQE